MNTASNVGLDAGAGAGQASGGRERRKDERYLLHNAEGTLIYRWERIRCSFVDVSLSGCRVRTEVDFEAGALAAVDLILCIYGIQVRLRGVTQWVARNRLIGVRFIHHSPRSRNELASLLNGLVDKEAAKVVIDAVSSLPLIREKGLLLSQGAMLLQQEQTPLPRETAPPPMANQNVEDEWQEAFRRRAEQDRLEALEALGDSVGVVEPAPTASGGGAPEDSHDSRVKNMSGDEWSATVRFLANDAQVSGRLVDLSKAGCLFKTVGKYPGARGSHVEIEFQLRGLPFRIAGITVSGEDTQTAEIGFTEVGMRKQRDLAEALDELAEESGRMRHG